MTCHARPPLFLPYSATILFCLIILAFSLCRLWRHTFYQNPGHCPFRPRSVRKWIDVASLALRSGVPEIQWNFHHPVPPPSSCSSNLCSSSLTSRSRSSDSDTSLWASFTGLPDPSSVLPRVQSDRLDRLCKSSPSSPWLLWTAVRNVHFLALMPAGTFQSNGLLVGNTYSSVIATCYGLINYIDSAMRVYFLLAAVPT